MSNLSQRLLVAIIGIPVIVYLTTYGSWPLLIFALVLQVLLLREWLQLAAGIEAKPFIPTLVLSVASVDFAVMTSSLTVSLAVVYAALLLTMLVEIFRPSHQPFRNLGAAFLFLLYAALPVILLTQFGPLNITERFSGLGPLTVLLFSIWICDSAAYFVGRSLGRHKLYVAASPNKTIEGGVGGLVSSALILPVMSVCGWANPNPMDYLALPVIVGIIGQLGDLLESLLKREVHVKDSSNFLPGHGGLLDRFDSLLLSAPFFYLYLAIVK